MLRETLLYLSEQEGVKDALLRVPVLRRVAGRFVAGDELEDALAAARQLNDDGLRVTLDHLGESVDDREAARGATDAYRHSLRAIDRSGAESTISLKLTQLGLDIDREFCLANLRRILALAADLDSFVRIDMESSRYTDATLQLFREVWPAFRGRVGVVVQAYLRRSEDDVADLVQLEAPVRLCKGAYDEPPDLAYQDRDRVDRNFVRLARMLLDGGAPTAVATHDERMIEATREHMRRRGMERGEVEFQMLYGVRRRLQRRMASEGHPVRVYVPYGSEWYPYLMRRMAERPANLALVLRALVSG